MQDLLITSCSNVISETPEVLVTLNSLKNVGFNGDKIVFTNWMPYHIGKRFFDDGFNIKIISQSHKIDVVGTDVLRYFLEAMSSQAYRNIYVTDCRDVFFIRTFQQIQPLEHVFLTNEKWKYKDKQWNINDMNLLMNYFPKKDFMDWDVINGGGLIFGGQENMFRFYLIQHACVNQFSQASNQAIINYFYHTCNMYDWKTTDKYFCLTGSAISGKESLYNYHEYSVFHQWDRTILKKEIIKNWAF